MRKPKNRISTDTSFHKVVINEELLLLRSSGWEVTTSRRDSQRRRPSAEGRDSRQAETGLAGLAQWAPKRLAAPRGPPNSRLPANCPQPPGAWLRAGTRHPHASRELVRAPPSPARHHLLCKATRQALSAALPLQCDLPTLQRQLLRGHTVAFSGSDLIRLREP